MKELFARNILYWGEDAQKKLSESCVAVFGLGGVGGFCAEALARSGVGSLLLVDFDKVSISNINRQIVASTSTVGALKTELFYKRLKDINPDIDISFDSNFYQEKYNFVGVDFVADAIDTMRSKINLLCKCYNEKVPVISSMGAGNRIDPTQLYISDISEIHDKKAPFVSNIIYQLKKRGIISGIKVVASDEKSFVQQKISELECIKTQEGEEIEFNKIIPSSTPFVAPPAGLFMASYIVREIIK